MDKKKILKYGASVLVLGVTITTAIYLSKKVLLNIAVKKSGKTKEELSDKGIVELFKTGFPKKDSTVVPPEDTTKTAPKEEEK